MKTLLHLIDSGQVKFNDPYFRFFASLAAAQFIVTLLEEKKWWQLLDEMPYYTALIVSFSIALLIIYTVYKANAYLDAHYPWTSKVIKRILLQLLWGVTLPLTLGVIAVSIYYYKMGTNIFDTQYLPILLRVKLLLVLMLNVYYFVLMIITAKRMRQTSPQEEKMAVAEEETYTELHSPVDEKPAEAQAVQQEPLLLPPGWALNELMLVRSEKRKMYVFSKDGSHLPWTTTITETYTLLPPNKFINISQSCIVRFSNICRATYSNDKRSIHLLLHVPKNKVVSVTRLYKEAFIERYKRKIYRHREK